MRAKTFAMKMHFMMKNFFSGALWKEYVDGMAYAHNIKRVEKKLNYESDENACLHEKQNLDMLNEFFWCIKKWVEISKSFSLKVCLIGCKSFNIYIF